MRCKGCYLVLLLLLGAAGLTPLLSVPAHAGPAAQVGGDCALLDDPGALAAMSGISEWTLRERCGRLDEPAPVLKGPVPAVPPPVGTDVRVNAVDPPGGGGSIQSETSIAVNLNTGTICATFNDIYHWPNNGASGFSCSTDGGQTWQDGGPFPPGGGGVSNGDPSVAWRRTDGYFYYTSLLRVGTDLYVGLWRSVDDCATFGWVGVIHMSTFDDKEFLAIDNNPGSPYYGRFYVVWTDIGVDHRIRLAYSDDGATWLGPVVLSTPDCQGAWPAVAPNGDIYVAWMRADNYPYGPIDTEVARSVDGGASFFFVANPLTDALAPRDPQATANCGRPALKANATDGIRYYAMPQIVVGPDGCLHVAYSYDPDGYGVGDVVNVYYRRSCDHGATWEEEVLLNDDGTLTDQFFPAVAVSADNVVVASWYDRRLDPVENYLFDRYWTISYDGGTTWEPNARVSDVSSPVYTSNCYHGDYDQLATLGDAIYHIWSDDRIFFNGHYDPDIWFDQAAVQHDFSLAVDPDWHEVCRPNVVTSTVIVEPVGIFDQPITLSDSGVPAEVQTAFTVNPVDPLPGVSTYVITVTESAVDGTYTWLVTGASPTLTHQVAVTLTVQDCSCEPVHDVDFTWEPITPTVGEVVTFTGWASGTEPITYSWWLEGASGEWEVTGHRLQVAGWKEGPVVTHTYDLPGEYAVVLTATNCQTATATVVHTVTVLPEPCEPVHAVDFFWTPVTPTVGQVVTLTGTAAGTLPITYSWELGDGSLASGQLVTYSYSLPGTYSVTMTATNCGTATVAVVHTITVACDAVADADFTWEPLMPTAGQPITLTATATGTLPVTYSWELGDGSLASGPVVTHSYSLPGAYRVTMTATNCQTATATAVHTITVLPEPCEAVEIITVTQEISGCVVTFGAELTGTAPFTFWWDFGSFGASTETNPVVDFAATGTYTGTLEVWNCGGVGHDGQLLTVAVECVPTAWRVYLPLAFKGHRNP